MGSCTHPSPCLHTVRANILIGPWMQRHLALGSRVEAGWSQHLQFLSVLVPGQQKVQMTGKSGTPATVLEIQSVIGSYLMGIAFR